jgi:hypothetical protein
MGASLSGLQQPPSQIIDVMSIYHPFPLRLDSLNKGAPVQYDACLQLGEFPSARYKGNTAVVLFPLKVKRNPGPKGKFMDDIASKIPTILGQQPDPITGYPDVPAHTGADWSIEDILFMKDKSGQTVSRAFYAWFNKTPFPVGVVVMAEPVYISQTNMDAIKRLPITPPSDVIHEIGTPILYKPGPIFDEEGNPQPCPATKADMAKQAMDSIIQPPIPTKKSGIDLDLFFQIVLGALGTLVVILGVWMGIKFAMGPGSTIMKTIGDSLGKSLAGGYEAIKKAKMPVMPAMPPIPQSVKDSVNKTRRNIGNRLGLGATGNFGTKRQAPTDKSIDEVFPVLKPEKDIEMTNPLFKSKDDFSKFQDRNRTRRNLIRQKPKQGTISAIANLPAANIPEPAPAPAPAAAPSVENIIDDMPSGVTVNPRVRKTGSIGSIRGIPEVADAPAPKDTPADIANTPAPKDTPAEVSNLPTPKVNPALEELEELEKQGEKVSVAKQLHAALNPVSPPVIPSQRNKTLRNSALKTIAANQAKKKLGQVQARREIDSWIDDSPAPASASVPAPVSAPAPSEDALVPKSEFKTWDRRRQSEYVQKIAKKYNKRLVSSYINVMSQTIGSKPWNPSTKIDSVSRLAKGGRKRRNRRKTGHQLRNRKKTGRKI